MRVLIIGGTQLTGPFLVRALLRMGHHVTIFHRNNHPENVPAGVAQIIAPREEGGAEDRLHLLAMSDRLRGVNADVVVHMIAYTRADAESFVRVFEGHVARAVVVSSSDVYRVMGICNRTEAGPPVPVPIDEDGPLRQRPSIHAELRDKRWVEQTVLASARLPATVLRFPAVYGPGTFRRQEWVKRMIDGRPAIIMGKGEATFRFSHGYASDMGWAIALAIMEERAAARIYNVGEKEVPTERRRLEDFAQVFGWNGRIVEVDDEMVPGGDGLPYHGQDWLLDTRRIRAELSYREFSGYEAGIRETIEWQRSHENPRIDHAAFDYHAEDRLLATL